MLIDRLSLAGTFDIGRILNRIPKRSKGAKRFPKLTNFSSIFIKIKKTN